eukprot:3685076-Pyramimonas_sp.AAC.1
MSLQLALMPPPAAAPVPKAKGKAKAKSNGKTAVVEVANDAAKAWWTKYRKSGSFASGSEACTLALAAPEVANLADFEGAPDGDD